MPQWPWYGAKVQNANEAAPVVAANLQENSMIGDNQKKRRASLWIQAIIEQAMSFKPGHWPFLLWSLAVLVIICGTLAFISYASPLALYFLASGGGIGGGVMAVLKYYRPMR